MTIQDVRSHRCGASEFYKRYVPKKQIGEAVKEPLKLRDLMSIGSQYGNERSNYAVGLALACVNEFLSEYHRKDMPNEEVRFKIAQRIVAEYPDYSVCDLKCFSTMLTSGRLPTYSAGGENLGLIVLDLPHVMEKFRVYDGKRPGVVLAGYTSNESTCRERAFTPWQQTHLLDGTEWDFSMPYPGYDDQGDAMTNALAYWREDGFRKDERDEAAINKIIAKTKQSIIYIR